MLCRGGQFSVSASPEVERDPFDSIQISGVQEAQGELDFSAGKYGDSRA